MKKFILLSAFVVLLSITSLFAQTRESRNVGTFSKISYRVPGKLYLRQGNTQKVELEGNKEILEEIETTVEGSRLVIQRKGRWNDWRWGRDEKITVYITVKDLEGLNVAGSGDAIAETKFSTRDLELKVSGSGSLKIEADASGDVEADVSGSGSLNLKGKSKNYSSGVSGSGRVIMNMTVAERSNFSVSGSGRIEATGATKTVKASISGSGKILAADLEASRCEVRISGSGDAEVHVKSELDANIAGSGSVRYRGNPEKVNSHSSGSGKVRKM